MKRPTLRDRLDQRREIADARYKHQAFFSKIANRIGLYLSDFVDVVTAWADDDRVVFFGATGAGLARGAAYGILATIAVASVFSLGTAATPLLLASMAVGAVAYGIHDGQKGLEDRLTGRHTHTSDDIAKLFGALPGRPLYPTPNPKIVAQDEVYKGEVEKMKLVEEDPSLSYVKREAARRGQIVQNPNPQR